jgi:hypothetical protein
VHPDRRRSKWVIRWKDQGTPVLAIVIRRLRWSCEDVMPSVAQSVFHLYLAGVDLGTYSRILDSDGCAIMYGGGFSAIVLYSRVNYHS